MRRIVFASMIAAALAAPALTTPAMAAPAATEGAAVTQALGDLCQEYFKPGASQDIKKYTPRVADWKLEEPPGVYAFNKSGDWGRVRAAFSSEFDGGPCRLSVFKLDSATTHDAAPTLSAIDAWARTAIKAGKRQKDRVKAEKGPPGSMETSWKGGGLIIVARELPPEGHRPVMQIDVRKAP